MGGTSPMPGIFLREARGAISRKSYEEQRGYPPPPLSLGMWGEGAEK